MSLYVLLLSVLLYILFFTVCLLYVNVYRHIYVCIIFTVSFQATAVEYINNFTHFGSCLHTVSFLVAAVECINNFTHTHARTQIPIGYPIP